MPGLPAGLSLGEAACTETGSRRECAWGLSGTLEVPSGIYTITATAADRYGLAAQTELHVAAAAEDAVLILAASNPSTVTVPAEAGASGPFSLAVDVQELKSRPGRRPETGRHLKGCGHAGAAGGGSGRRRSSRTPVRRPSISGTGYGAVLHASCRFEAVPPGRYRVQAEATGGYYVGTALAALEVAPASVQPALWLPIISRP